MTFQIDNFAQNEPCIIEGRLVQLWRPRVFVELFIYLHYFHKNLYTWECIHYLFTQKSLHLGVYYLFPQKSLHLGVYISTKIFTLGSVSRCMHAQLVELLRFLTKVLQQWKIESGNIEELYAVAAT